MPKRSQTDRNKAMVRRAFKDNQAEKDWSTRSSKDSAIGRAVETSADVENTPKRKRK